MTPFSHYEFFCGGGMARIGLGDQWHCLAANDIDPSKCDAYRANFGDDHLIQGDVSALTAADMPERADMAWASFPCQDLSLAGARGGLASARSGAFWGFWSVIERLLAEGRAPPVLVIENVVGLASSHGGQDLAALLITLANAGYHFDVRVIDAAAFLPQSRPRLFVIAWSRTSTPPHAVAEMDPIVRHAAPHLGAATSALRPLALPIPPHRNTELAVIVEPDMPFWPTDRTNALLSLMAQTHRARVDDAKCRARDTDKAVYGAVFRRMRGGVQRAETRFDLAGCLRTPSGGSSKQILLAIGPDGATNARHFTGREAARLMGLPDWYALPTRETAALKLCGDGVAVPVVRYIAKAIVEPILNADQAKDAPRLLEPLAAAE